MITVLPQKFYDAFNTQNALLASIASHVGSGGIEISSWDDMQKLVRMGLADKIFAVGDQIVSSYNSGELTWDIIGIDQDTPTDAQFTHSLTLQTHNCIGNVMFDKSEALYYAATELAAGDYFFTYNATTYQFTLTQAVPAGGQITFPWAYNTDILTTKISTYASKTATAAIESNISITAGSTGTEITPINDMNRCRYGSNNYKESAIKQWLNSSAASFAWAAQTNYDRPPTEAPFTGAGFLNLLDADLASVLGNVNKATAKNTITDGGGSESSSEKIFLLSRSEVYTGLENGINEGAPYSYYSALASAATSGALAGRIKYLSGAARYWWLRSPSASYSHGPRYITTTGELNNNNAYNANGCAPACCIV